MSGRMMCGLSRGRSVEELIGGCTVTNWCLVLAWFIPKVVEVFHAALGLGRMVMV